MKPHKSRVDVLNGCLASKERHRGCAGGGDRSHFGVVVRSGGADVLFRRQGLQRVVGRSRRVEFTTESLG